MMGAQGRFRAKVALIGLCLIGAVQMVAGAVVPAKAVAAQILLDRAFDRSIAAHQPQKPWPWADMAPIARISVPRLGVGQIVIDTGSGQAMAFGPTLLPGGARLGEGGTSVIAAHRDTHFRFLKDLKRGDEIRVQDVKGHQLRYRVTSAQIVMWNGFSIDRHPDAGLLVLTTCYPFDSTTRDPLRYAVEAQQIDGEA